MTWLADRKVLCCGDLFIWASPNAGNPQKVQRYPLEWAQALRRMMALEPEFLLPGHGVPVIGADRVAQALSDTAELLESLVSQTLDVMNGGGRLDEAIHTVTVPASLADRPYLQPVYDEPEFIVRTVWRLYGGWWDGNPATLKPAPERCAGGGARQPGRRRRGAGGPSDRAGRRRPRGRAAADGEGEPPAGGPPCRACLASGAWRSGGCAGTAPRVHHPRGRGHLDHGDRGIQVGGR